MEVSCCFIDRSLSHVEHEFKSTYIKLSQQAATFATELLEQTRGMRHNIMASQCHGVPVSRGHDLTPSMTMGYTAICSHTKIIKLC